MRALGNALEPHIGNEAIQPVELPLFGRMERTSYTKEELMELWERIAPPAPFWITAAACALTIPIAWTKFKLPTKETPQAGS